MNQTSSGLYIALCLQAIAECEDQTEECKPSWRFDKNNCNTVQTLYERRHDSWLPTFVLCGTTKITQFSTSTLMVFIQTLHPLFNFPTRWRQIVRPSGSFSNKKTSWGILSRFTQKWLLSCMWLLGISESGRFLSEVWAMVPVKNLVKKK